MAQVNETLIRDQAIGDFLDHRHNVVLIGGTETGKTHLAVRVARTCIRAGHRVRFFNAVDLLNKLDADRGQTQSRLTWLTRLRSPRRTVLTGRDIEEMSTELPIPARVSGF